MPDITLPQNECILAIGDTGLGKSFTATIFGAKHAKVGDSTKSETDKVTFYDIGNGSLYVDTPGFNDSNEGKTDNNTVRSIWRGMQDRKISKITTILWFVAYECRAAASFKRQARLIEDVAQDYNGNVWDNVIIVTKDSKRGEGPRAAAEEVAKEVYKKKPNYAKSSLLKKTRNFEILLLESFAETQRKIYNALPIKDLEELNIFRKSESKRIFAKYRSLMEGHVGHPIILKFEKVKCLKCSEETDRRLASSKCHVEINKIHHGQLVAYHGGKVNTFHSGQYVESKILEEMDHSVEAWTLRVITIGIVNPQIRKVEDGWWKCCNKKLGSEGCKSQYECCKKSVGSNGCTYKYGCCNAILHDCNTCKECKSGKCKVLGCTSVCSKCKQNPVKSKGCSIEGEHVWNR